MAKMRFLSKLLGRGVAQTDEPLPEQLKALTAMLGQQHQFAIASGLTPPNTRIPDEADCVAGGEGPFGKSHLNPIPVNAVQGELIYLSSLVTENGSRLFFHRRGGLSSDRGIVGRVDEYEVLAADGSVRMSLYFDMYYPRRSRLAPDDFRLIPWNQMTEFDRLMARLGSMGTNHTVANFPFGLPTAIEERMLQEGISQDMLDKMIPALSGVLTQALITWTRAQ